MLKSTRRLISMLLCSCILATCTDLHASEHEDSIIEQNGDSYVIHVNAMNPDSEMTLMDILQLCPEMVTLDGKDIAENFIICVDNMDFFLDHETFIEHVKASEINTITIYTNPSVSQGVSGAEGIIDIIFEEKSENGIDGKIAAKGNTYGNGNLYADVRLQKNNLVMKGYALANQRFGKATPTSGMSLSSRSLTENTHLSIDWDISPADNLLVKVDQQFRDSKQKSGTGNLFNDMEKAHLGCLEIWYTRELNDNEATLQAGLGIEYANATTDETTKRELLPAFQVDLETPLFHDDLSLLTGYSLGYNNILSNTSRQHYLQNDIYAQLNFTPGPWNITLGGLFTRLNYWNRFRDAEKNNDFSKHISNYSLVAIVGHHWGKHYLQGAFQREFYIPTFDDFYEDVTGEEININSYGAFPFWEVEARYTYQLQNFLFFANIYHEWTTDTPTLPEDMTGIRASCTWYKGPFRLTTGAGFYHLHIDGDESHSPKHDNFVRLKMAPVLLLGKGLRLSASLIYNSRQVIYGNHAHLYASVKVNKDLGRHCNIFANFQDIAGSPTVNLQNLDKIYYQRALNIGMTYRF